MLRSPLTEGDFIAETYRTNHPHIHSFKEMAPIGFGWPGFLAAVPIVVKRLMNELIPSSLSSVRLFEWLLQRDEKTMRWRFQYTVATLVSDVLAALVITCLLLPQSMSYALLAGAPVQYGLYASVVPPFMYAIFTTVGSLQYGIVAPTSILSNGIVHGLTDAAEKSELFVMRSIQLGFACGVVYAIMLVLRMSWLARYLSLPVLNGFVWGSALIIVASQLKDLFGITYSGSPRDFGSRVHMAFANAGSANKVSVGLGLISLFLLLYIKDISIRGCKLPKLTPVPLLIILVVVPLSWGLDLQNVHGVKVIGAIPSDLPTFKFPFSSSRMAANITAASANSTRTNSTSTAMDMGGGEVLATVLPSAVILALVSFVQTLGVAYTFTKKSGQTFSASRELAGCTAAHLIGACFGSLTVSGGITRTAVAFDAGAKTPGTGIFVGCFLLLAIKFLTPYLRYLPTCVLAAIVTSSTRNLLDPSDALVFWKGKKSDFITWLVTVVAMLILDVQNGLFTGIGFSLFIVLLRAFRPRCVELGRLPGMCTPTLSTHPCTVH
jgi:SulP family sulfate permease